MSNESDLFSIGEFSQISGLSVKTLRFYDEKGLLKPALVDASSGYRYYDGAAADRARIIARLRELQFPLEAIGAMLAECGDEADLLGYFERQQRAIAERIRADRRTARALETIIAAERAAARIATEPAAAVVRERQVEPMLVAGLRLKGRYEECGNAFARLGRAAGRHAAGRPLTLYYDSEYREDDADFEPCVPLTRAVPAADGIDVRPLPGGTCLTIVHRGPYSQLGRSYRKVLGEAKRRRLGVLRPTREVYVKGPGMIFRGDPDNYLTEIQLPFAP